jgi:hypothetical protein
MEKITALEARRRGAINLFQSLARTPRKGSERPPIM